MGRLAWALRAAIFLPWWTFEVTIRVTISAPTANNATFATYCGFLEIIRSNPNNLSTTYTPLRAFSFAKNELGYGNRFV
jgi:hypothetical protein